MENQIQIVENEIMGACSNIGEAKKFIDDMEYRLLEMRLDLRQEEGRVEGLKFAVERMKQPVQIDEQGKKKAKDFCSNLSICIHGKKVKLHTALSMLDDDVDDDETISNSEQTIYSMRDVIGDLLSLLESELKITV